MSRTNRLVAASALLLAAAPAAAQRWEIDLAAASVQFRTSAYADISCDNPGQIIIPPGPGDAGLCPPNPFAGGPPGSEFSYDEGNVVVGPFYWTDPSGILTLHFGGGAANPVEDLGGFPCGFGDYASSEPIAIVQGNGLNTRTLKIKWWAEVNHETNFDGPYATRGCADLVAALSATVTDVPQDDYIVRYDWRAYGDVDGLPECPADPNCFAWGMPAPEDILSAELDLDVSFNNGAVPGNLLPNLTIANDPGTGWPDVVVTPTGSDVVAMTGGSSFEAEIDLVAEAFSQWEAPFPTDGDDGARFIGEFNLAIISHRFNTDEPFDQYMRTIPGNTGPGTGPQYRFRMGRYEITNQQYADFLNSAEADLGLTELSSNMIFQPDGSVKLPDGAYFFKPQNVLPDSRIVFDSFAPVGTRYTVQVPLGSDPRSYEKHPVVHVSWWGALKFCNWLTLTRGLPASERCYIEGPSRIEWRPATITLADWTARDLNDAERQALVNQYAGFRLPMDNLAVQAGWIGSQAGDFNEWYKAAAYDPAAPDVDRAGPGGELVPPDHWTYAFGRDAITITDANYQFSTDPFDDDDAFVGLFNGTHYNPGGPSGGGNVGSGADFQSQASANPWGLYDLSGNVAEWMQERFGPVQRAVRGGSWATAADRCAASYRTLFGPGGSPDSNAIGFRIVQSSCPADINFDGVIDVSDLLLMLAAWGASGGAADLNGDGTVNVSDLLILLAAWGACT
jgi:formylglycine-generating enzyme required for sulfatase activity